MKIYCIGDSHAHFFGGKSRLRNWQKERRYPRWCINRIPIFEALIVGDATAYNLHKTGSTSQGREKLLAAVEGLPKGSKIMLVFGEIDCRVHLLKQAKLQNRPIEDVVSECVGWYISVFLELKNRGFEMIVWAVTPTALFEGAKEFTIYGTWEDRLYVTRLFNKYLKEMAEHSGIKFLSIFEELLNEDGLPNPDNYSDGIHLNQYAMPIVLAKVKEIYERG